MIIGHQEAQKSLRTYLEQNPSPGFILLYGPAHIGKSFMVQEISKDILGTWMYNDFLYIKDYSQELGKTHHLKIEENENNSMSKELMNEYNYRDIGVREINFWLQMSSLGKQKIVLLENIERMEGPAASAFLKTLEEGFSQKIVIATTSQKHAILPTILSRSILVQCYELSPTEMEQYRENTNIFADSEGLKNNQNLQELILDMAMGRPGIVEQLVHIFNTEPELIHTIDVLMKMLTAPGNIANKQAILMKLDQYGFFERFIDAWIKYCVDHQNTVQAERWIKVKSMIEANVKKENAIVFGLM